MKHSKEPWLRLDNRVKLWHVGVVVSLMWLMAPGALVRAAPVKVDGVQWEITAFRCVSLEANQGETTVDSFWRIWQQTQGQSGYTYTEEQLLNDSFLCSLSARYENVSHNDLYLTSGCDVVSAGQHRYLIDNDRALRYEVAPERYFNDEGYACAAVVTGVPIGSTGTRLWRFIIPKVAASLRWVVEDEQGKQHSLDVPYSSASPDDSVPTEPQTRSVDAGVDVVRVGDRLLMANLTGPQAVSWSWSATVDLNTECQNPRDYEDVISRRRWVYIPQPMVGITYCVRVIDEEQQPHYGHYHLSEATAELRPESGSSKRTTQVDPGSGLSVVHLVLSVIATIIVALGVRSLF